MSSRVGELSVREAAFVEAFVGKANGNASEAYRMTHEDGVGRPGDGVSGHRLLKKANVTQAILVAAKAVSEQTRRETIADRVEQEEFLTQVLRGDVDETTAERLKAAEQLARRHGLILTKVESKGELTGKDGAPLIPHTPRTNAEIAAELTRLQAIAAETAADVDEIRKAK